MRYKYHISLSCLLLLLEFATLAASSTFGWYKYGIYETDRFNCPSGETQSQKCNYEGPCCIPCGRSLYQWYMEIEGKMWNLGCTRCPVRTQTDLILTGSNRDGPEDCTPCPYEHSYMMQNSFIEKNIDDDVSFQCRECPEHSTQDESVYNEPFSTGWSSQYPYWTSNTFSGNNLDNSMSCVCNAGFFFQQDVSADEHTCEECPRGTYKSKIANTKTCQACPSFYNSPAQSTAESDCSCDTPFIKQTDGTCVCPVDTFYENNLATCTNCQANAQAPMGSSSSLDCICNAGYRGQNGQMCTECPIETYKSFAGTSR